MSSNRRNTKREAKQAKENTKKNVEERKKQVKSYPFEEAVDFDESNENHHLSKEHSSMMGNDDKHDASLGGTGAPGEVPHSHGFLTFEGEDASSTIYHVPSFLLKTYEIVDVRIQS
jgi:hypothetical protein